MYSGFQDGQLHIPVLAETVTDILITDRSGTYIDCTLGGGGHTRELVKKLNTDSLIIGIDLDTTSVQYNRKFFEGKSPRVEVIHGNYKDIKRIASRICQGKINGILMDLGLASFQLANETRGFSYLQKGPLDMRYNRTEGKTAADVINKYSTQELKLIFYRYGEERKSGLIANEITARRKKKPIETTQELSRLITAVVGKKRDIKSLSRIFQAIRIEVNKELENIKACLEDSVDLLEKGGRIVVISYHSLEDRLVKDFFNLQARECICPPEIPICQCGKIKTLSLLTKRVIKPSDQEISINPRSRSARLRAAQKV